jgi:lipopolysaccharide transport system ATP-binding protein
LEVNIVELTSISKTFERRSGTGFRFLYSLLFRKKKPAKPSNPSDAIKYFFALNNLSLKVQKNKSIGVIGENGAGKSTLLQIISGTLTASSGTVKINGRVASLLELGSGFDPNFTGRENVVLNASILGLSKVEIDNRIASIIDFADIGDFIDKPVKSYSSGMTLRLAFSVIAHVDADLLIIDEALAVGDAFFIQKCMRFIRDFQKKGTLILVSHDIAAVQSLCTECIWLSKGKLIESGNTESVTKKYLTQVLTLRSDPHILDSKMNVKLKESKNLEVDLESGLALIKRVMIIDKATSNPINCFYGGERVTLEISVEVNGEILSPVVGFIVKNRLGQNLFSDNTLSEKCLNDYSKFEKVMLHSKFDFRMPTLQNGDYSLSVAIAEVCSDGEFRHHNWVHDALIITSISNKDFTGLVGIPMESKSLSLDY